MEKTTKSKLSSHLFSLPTACAIVLISGFLGGAIIDRVAYKKWSQEAPMNSLNASSAEIAGGFGGFGCSLVSALVVSCVADFRKRKKPAIEIAKS